MIVRGECGIFSPKLMEIFRMVRERFEELARSGEASEKENPEKQETRRREYGNQKYQKIR